MAIKKVVKKSASIKGAKVNGDRLRRSKPVTVEDAVNNFRTANDIHGDVMFNWVPYTKKIDQLKLESLWKEIENIKSNLYPGNAPDRPYDTTILKQPIFNNAESKGEWVVQEKPVQGLYSKLDMLYSNLSEFSQLLNNSIGGNIGILSQSGVHKEIVDSFYERIENLGKSDAPDPNNSISRCLMMSIRFLDLIKIQNDIITIIQS